MRHVDMSDGRLAPCVVCGFRPDPIDGGELRLGACGSECFAIVTGRRGRHTKWANR